MNFSIKDSFGKRDQTAQFPAEWVTFTQQIINGNFIFLFGGAEKNLFIESKLSQLHVIHYTNLKQSSYIFNKNITQNQRANSQPAIACSKLTIETLEQGVKYVQS